ncbi:unnamed protein product [Bursaphelenchus okinawaensis]|uniref:Phosphatidylinositol-glycan biosynthesis class X protein n=1 Tax=Bursaphelenchus okinawaensis TaxID=465554 RepID=A0A811LNV0_9BILA|nr:unnamed protein product [Bursaphelenchus okinawaensis]CAG9126414.1 unnamed protein product [Bursaphelenchus okinawaensis]
MDVVVEVSSMERLTECNLAYFYQIPKGLFIKVEAMNETLFNHCYLSSSWNLEDLSDSVAVTDLKPLIIFSKKQMRKVFVFKDEFKFPVHFRYNPAKYPEELPPIVEIASPRVYIRCMENKTLLEEETCYKNRENLACGCNQSPRCSYIRLNASASSPKQKATVPSGDKSKVQLVVASTLVFVFVCLVVIFVSTPAQKSKKK